MKYGTAILTRTVALNRQMHGVDGLDRICRRSVSRFTTAGSLPSCLEVCHHSPTRLPVRAEKSLQGVIGTQVPKGNSMRALYDLVLRRGERTNTGTAGSSDVLTASHLSFHRSNPFQVRYFTDEAFFARTQLRTTRAPPE